jgi:hypothetical protein
MCVAGHVHGPSPQHSHRFAGVARGGFAWETFFEPFEVFFFMEPPSPTFLGCPRKGAEAMDAM